jgi:hypothetical protein
MRPSIKSSVRPFLVLAFGFLAAMTSVSSAVASPDARDFRPRENRWRCEQAIQNLNSAQAYHDQMSYMVLNNPMYCPGGWETNAACMTTIANGYNQSVVNLQNAQDEYERACHGHRR